MLDLVKSAITTTVVISQERRDGFAGDDDRINTEPEPGRTVSLVVGGCKIVNRATEMAINAPSWMPSDRDRQ